jgi:hypothetical protein
MGHDGWNNVLRRRSEGDREVVYPEQTQIGEGVPKRFENINRSQKITGSAAGAAPMTAPQPPEYITTEENICEGCGMCKREGYQNKCCIITALRSRPHPPAPETLGDLIAKTNAGSLQAMIDEQCKEAARIATLAARKEVVEEIWNCSHRMWEGSLVTDIGAMERKLESLRQSTTAPDKPRCTMNHHNDDGTLIEYIGGGKPCNACSKRKECFEIFYAYRNSNRRQSTTAEKQEEQR